MNKEKMIAVMKKRLKKNYKVEPPAKGDVEPQEYTVKK